MRRTGDGHGDGHGDGDGELKQAVLPTRTYPRLQRAPRPPTPPARHGELKQAVLPGRVPDCSWGCSCSVAPPLPARQMPLLNAPERRARWHATHGTIADAGSAAVELLARIEATRKMHSTVMGQFSDLRADAQAQADAEWEQRSAERRAVMAENEKKREELWAAKAQEDREAKVERDKYSLEVALRHKRAMLTMQIEMMRRDAEHHKHLVGVTGNIEEGTGADTGIDAERAEQWLQISELPSYRLVLLVFETIDTDGSRSLDKDEIYNSPFGKKLEPHMESLDPNGDGDIDLEEWMAWFDALAETLRGDYGMFLVDLVWQSGIETSHLLTADEAARLIQARFRGNSWRLQKQQLTEIAIMIQTAWRGKAARNRRDILLDIRAGLRIQAWIRARKARRELERLDPQMAVKLKDCRGNVDAPPKAKKLFEKAGQMLQGGGEMSAEDWDKMVDLYLEAAKEGFPRKGRCYNGAGLGMCNSGRLQEGYEQFTKAIGEDIHDARSWHNRARCAFELGNIRQAHQDAMRARRETSQFPDHQEPGSTISGTLRPPSSRITQRELLGSRATAASRRRSRGPLRARDSVSWASDSIEDQNREPVESQETRDLWDACGEPGVKADPNAWLKARKLPKETKAQRKARKEGNVLAEKNLQLVSKLLQNGADTNFTQQGLTCLGRAAVVGNVEAAKMLLIWGAELERAAHQRRYKTCGYTPLMLAAQHGHVDVMKCLLAAGTYLETSSATTVKGREETVWTVAELHGTEEVVALLSEVAGPGNGWTHAHTAASGAPQPPSTDRPAVTTPRAAAMVVKATEAGTNAERLNSAKAALRARALARKSGQHTPVVDGGSSSMSDSVALAVAMRNDAMRTIMEGGLSVVSYKPATPGGTPGEARLATPGGTPGEIVHFPAIPSAQAVQ
eukprot:COSAG02_NODE_119_length_35335_cov_12.823192_16_plen_910_part_00